MQTSPTPQPPVVRTVVTETEPVERPVPRRGTAAGDRPHDPDRGHLLWWLGGGALAAGAAGTAATVLARRLRTPRPTAWQRLTRGDGTGLALGLSLASTALSVGVSRAVQARRRRQAEDALAASAPVDDVLLAAHLAEADVDPAPLAVEALPLEVVVLLDTLLDPALAEGRELPGAAALRAQLPHAHTVASVAEAIREDGEVPDWTPLVVETETEVERAVPNDMVWPVRARFSTDDGHELELRLQVIDGELGALVVTLPEDAEDAEDGVAAWDAFQELDAFPGVEQLRFQVDGDTRP